MAKRHHHSDMRPNEMHAEAKDSGMIHNEHSKFANLPTEVMLKPYSMAPAYMDFDMEDNIRGIDKQIGEDNSARKRGFSPHKY
jgi:hypothetical protein